MGVAQITKLQRLHSSVVVLLRVKV